MSEKTESINGHAFEEGRPFCQHPTCLAQRATAPAVSCPSHSVSVGKSTETLARPSPLAAVVLSRDREQFEAMDAGEFFALCSVALLESWPKDRAWPVQPRPRNWRPGVKVNVLGAEIFDALVLGGIPEVDILSAGSAAQKWVAASRGVSDPEVEAAADFSGAPKGG